MIAWFALAVALLALLLVLAEIGACLYVAAKIRPQVAPLLSMFTPPKQ